MDKKNNEKETKEENKNESSINFHPNDSEDLNNQNNEIENNESIGNSNLDKTKKKK